MKRSQLLSGALALAAVLALGLGPLFPAEAAPAGQAEYITVVVKLGDNLAIYARQYGVTGSAILAVNTIKDPNIIYPGQSITIPVVRSFTPSLTTPFYYVAQAGDSMALLGQRFAMAPSTIAWANGGSLTLTPGKTYLIPAGPHVHTVRAGETLKAIAALYQVTVDFVLRGNTLPNPDFIYPGQQIFIPIIYNARPVPIPEGGMPAPAPTAAAATPSASQPAATATPVPATATPVAAGNYITVKVRVGESLVTYVVRYGVSGASILAMNPQIKDANVIYPGDTLIIPVAVSFTPSRTTPFFYEAKSGDTAAVIANRFEMAASVLTAANPGATYAAGTTVLVPAGPHVYTVVQGDTLKIVAAKWGTTVEKLLQFNTLPNPDFIYPGQQIFIPLVYNAAPLPF